MSRADRINRGDWINIPGVGTVEVKRVRNPGWGNPVEIDYKAPRSNKSGVLVGPASRSVKRVFKPKGKQ